MRHVVQTALLFLFLALGAFPLGAEPERKPEAALPGEAKGLFRGKDVKLYSGGGDLSRYVGQPKKTAQKRSPLKHRPEDVCLDFRGDSLSWRVLDEYAELQLLESPLNIPPQATAQQIQQILESSKVRLQEILVNNYLKNAVLAYVARTNGLTLTERELAVAMTNSVRKVAGKKHGAEIVPKLFAREGYFFRNQENYLLTKKYIEGVLAKEIEVTPADLENLKKQRQEAIREAREKNAQLRPRLEGWLAEIKAGKRDFGETAWEFSECGSSQDNGDWGEFEADCTLLKPLKDFIFAPSEAELSDVIETPYSFHIVKILGRFYDSDDDSGNGSEGKDADEGGEKAKPGGAGLRSAPSGVLPVLIVLGVVTVVFSGVLLFCLPRTGLLRVVLSGGVLLGGAVIGVLVYANRTIPAPTRVRVAHIMLEKEEVPPELDDEGARVEFARRMIGRRTVALQERQIELAQREGKLKCAVRMTLLNRKKALEKKKALESKTRLEKKKGTKNEKN